jgi:hypothetical protein
VEGCALPLVLWISDRSSFRISLKKMFIRKAKVGEIHSMTKSERDLICSHVLSGSAEETTPPGKPSMGVFAALLGVFTGVPEILIGGMSLDKQGYSYPLADGRVMHANEDRAALQLLASKFPALRTTERAIAQACNVPLYG